MLPAEIYRDYIKWMDEAKLRALGKQNFYEQIYLNYPHVTRKRKSDGKREYFYGIGVRARDDDE